MVIDMKQDLGDTGKDDVAVVVSVRDVIYTVSVVHFRDCKYGASPWCVGWFSSYEKADTCARETWGNINEYSYEYVVVEAVESGLYPDTTQHWYAWVGEKEGYIPCAKPVEAEGINGWSIG